jgi:NADH-quinone oxidoreductase subunit H
MQEIEPFIPALKRRGFLALFCNILLTGMVYLLLSSFGLSNLVFLITIGVLNWVMLYGFVRLVKRATSASTRHAQAPALRAQRQAKQVPQLVKGAS